MREAELWKILRSCAERLCIEHRIVFETFLLEFFDTYLPGLFIKAVLWWWMCWLFSRFRAFVFSRKVLVESLVFRSKAFWLATMFRGVQYREWDGTASVWKEDAAILNSDQHDSLDQVRFCQTEPYKSGQVAACVQLLVCGQPSKLKSCSSARINVLFIRKIRTAVLKCWMR